MALRSRRRQTRPPDPTDLREGTVTRLAYQKNDSQRVSIYVDEAFALGVHADVIVRFGIRKGMVLDVETQVAMLEADAFYRGRAAALKFLGHRPRTAAEVSRRLGEKGFPPEVTRELVESLAASGLIDDERYAREFAGARLSNRGYGPDRVKLELLKRGIEKNLAEQVVSELFTDADVMQTAFDHARKAWDKSARETDELKRRKKVYAYLVRRGFDFETARAAVERLDS